MSNCRLPKLSDALARIHTSLKCGLSAVMPRAATIDKARTGTQILWLAQARKVAMKTKLPNSSGTIAARGAMSAGTNGRISDATKTIETIATYALANAWATRVDIFLVRIRRDHRK